MDKSNTSQPPSNPTRIIKKKVPYDIETLNNYLANKRAAYEFLSQDKGYYLPAYQTAAITEDYLKGILTDEFEHFIRNEIKICYWTKKVSKLELLAELAKVCKLPLGITEKMLPNKEWLINCLFSRDPENKFFKNIPDIPIVRELPSGVFAELSVPFKTAKRKSFFRMTEEEKQTKHYQAKAKSLKKKINRQTFLEIQLNDQKQLNNKLLQELATLGEKIKNIEKGAMNEEQPASSKTAEKE
jgi:hypothetical protein